MEDKRGEQGIERKSGGGACVNELRKPSSRLRVDTGQTACLHSVLGHICKRSRNTSSELTSLPEPQPWKTTYADG